MIRGAIARATIAWWRRSIATSLCCATPKRRTPPKIEALRFLIHFVGDLHQPLHAADRRDKGGNGLIVFMKSRRTNLHRVWDEDLVEALGPDAGAVAGSIEAGLSPQDKARLAAGTPADWANESFSVAAKEIYARIPSRGPVRLPRDYARRENAAVRLQLARAGIRLGDAAEPDLSAKTQTD